MKINDIILFIIIICIIYLLYCNKNKENFANGASGNESITESIKNLGIIARRIQEDDNLTLPTNLTVPGNLNVREDVNITGNLNVREDVNITGKFNLLPEGCILMWGQEEIPQGWVLCDGSAHLKKEFFSEISSELPRVIPNNFGIPVGSNNKYTITPNLGGRFVLGSGAPDLVNNFPNDGGLVPTGYLNESNYNVNKTGGERRHELTLDELPDHQHYLPRDRGGSGNREHSYHPVLTIDFAGRHLDDESHYIEDGEQKKRYTPCHGCNKDAHNNMPPYHVLKYIMKVY